MSAVTRIDRPAIEPGLDPNPVRQARIRLVHRLAAWHVAATAGELRMPVLVALDHLLPAGPLPPVVLRLAPGVEVELDGSGALARGCMIAAGYEHREAETLASAVRPGGVFIDVGANIGLLSMLVARARPDATVWALEPVPATADLLSRHVCAAGLDGVRPMRIAAGAASGESLILATSDNAFAHEVAQPSASTVGTLTRCPTLPLDTLWAREGRPRVDAIKIDVEGAELAVLVGAEQVLTEHHPLLIVEAPTEQAARAVSGELRRFGYRRRFPRGMLPYNACFSVASRSRR